MSLVDSDHVQPTWRRHNVRYFQKADHAGQLKPAMTIFLHELSSGSEGMCGHFIQDAFPSPKSYVVSYAFCKECNKSVELKRN